MRTTGICPACGKEIIMQATCPQCNFNIEIFEKAKRISIYLYNKGLDEYNSGCVLDSIATLEKSLNFYKNNVVARNLLGLIYYSIGEISEAVKEWVISTSIKKEDNTASKYLADVEKCKDETKTLNDAIKIYNEALKYAKQGNDDIAIIRLQKATSLSPDFLKANILLMLLYAKEDATKDKAKIILDKIKNIDKKSKIIRLYSKEVLGSSITNEKEKKQKPEKVKRVYEEQGKKYFYLGKLKISRTFIWCIVTAIISLIFAFYLGGFDQIAKSRDEALNKVKELEEQYKELEEKNKENEDLLLGYQTEEKKELDAKNIVDAKNLVNEKEYSKAYALIKDVNVDLLSEESKAVYDSILPLTVKEFSKSKYNEGKTLFEAEDYESAFKALNESLELNDDESFTPEVMYYIARIYEKQQDTKKAKEMYARIINEYPDTHTAEQAKYYSGLLN